MDKNGSSESSPEPGSPLSVESLKRDEGEDNRQSKWRNLVGYWILGLCNNYGYVVMLSAAHDILSNPDAGGGGHGENGHNSTLPTNPRGCNPMSTGAILLADIIPSLVIKFLAPFLPFCIHIRIGLSVIFQAAGYILVALSSYHWAIVGVVCTSFASGLGEVTFLSYTTYFKEKVISTWSSGTGGAGIIGALSYAGLTSLGLSSSTTMFIMLFVPALEAVVFIFLLKHPGKISVCNAPNEDELRSIMKNLSTEPDVPITNVTLTLQQKIKIAPTLLKYMLPLVLVYLFEYFINQGIFELIYFDGIWLNRQEQYRWLQVDYQVGVFLSRSSLHCFQFRWLWLLAVLQGLNVIFFTMEAIYYFCPSIWIVLAFVLWEGLLGGASYVNTFHRISQEAPPDRKEFSVGVVCMSDSFGIGLAGIIAIPVHNILCALPLYN